MAVPSLPTRDHVREAITSFVKLARDAPSAKGDEEAELFGFQLPLSLANASMTAQAHAHGSRDRESATRFVVEEVARQGFYAALAGVVDLLTASPDTRLAMPASKMRALPDPLNQEMPRLVDESDDGCVPALPLYSGCLKGILGACRVRMIHSPRGCRLRSARTPGLKN
jgi:hypothetical protein